jgi:hypothetical protein
MPEYEITAPPGPPGESLTVGDQCRNKIFLTA